MSGSMRPSTSAARPSVGARLRRLAQERGGQRDASRPPRPPDRAPSDLGGRHAARRAAHPRGGYGCRRRRRSRRGRPRRRGRRTSRARAALARARRSRRRPCRRRRRQRWARRRAAAAAASTAAFLAVAASSMPVTSRAVCTSNPARASSSPSWRANAWSAGEARATRRAQRVGGVAGPARQATERAGRARRRRRTGSCRAAARDPSTATSTPARWGIALAVRGDAAGRPRGRRSRRGLAREVEILGADDVHASGSARPGR